MVSILVFAIAIAFVLIHSLPFIRLSKLDYNYAAPGFILRLMLLIKDQPMITERFPILL
jgi:hypothetical protein